MKKSPTSKQAKVVVILATYIWKNLQRVCFTVLSSDGKTRYNTCFTNGHGACSCPARPGTCYHITQLAPIAAAKLAERDRKAAPASYDVVTEAEHVVEAHAGAKPAGIEKYFFERSEPRLSREAYEMIFDPNGLNL